MEYINLNNKDEEIQGGLFEAVDLDYSFINTEDESLIASTFWDSSGASTEEITLISSVEDGAKFIPGTYLTVASSQEVVDVLLLEEGPFYRPTQMAPTDPSILMGYSQGPVMSELDAYVTGIATHLGIQSADGKLMPKGVRPMPNQPVRKLTNAEVSELENMHGDFPLGIKEPPHEVEATLSSGNKELFATGMFVVGQPGTGKSVTNNRLITNFHDTGFTTNIIDTEGEYCGVEQPAIDKEIVKRLKEQGEEPEGILQSSIFNLINTEPRNPNHHNLSTFSPRFDSTAPELIAEIVGMNSAQEERFGQTYDIGALCDEEIGINPKGTYILNTDQSDGGSPNMKVEKIIDIINTIFIVKGWNPEEEDSEPYLFSEEYKGHYSVLKKVVRAQKKIPDQIASWKKVSWFMHELRRKKIFDQPEAAPIDYSRLLNPGDVNVIDLSGLGTSFAVKNLVITEILSGLQNEQEKRFKEASLNGYAMPSALQIIIDECHQLLSKEATDKMPQLSSKLRQLAMRGRKRRVGLVLATQSPDSVSKHVLDMIGSYVIHRSLNPDTVNLFKKTLGLSNREARSIASLRPGQALCCFPGQWERPQLVNITPGRFRALVPLDES